MKNIAKVFLLALFCLVASSVFSQDFITYTLDNGLTVYLWPDGNQPDVTGVVAVRAGSIDEPAEYTGLAHYLEHVLFKGTHKIGVLDWEKEKTHYDRIIHLYDKYAEASDPLVRAD